MVRGIFQGVSKYKYVRMSLSLGLLCRKILNVSDIETFLLLNLIKSN